VPELGEVEYFRRQWDCGLGQRVRRVTAHAHSRVLRRVDAEALTRALTGATLLASESHGKQMFFRFSKGGWLGLHLGMTGRLRVEPPEFEAGRHDHLVLVQHRQALVFTDARQFGRVLFHSGAEAPAWWSQRAVAVTSSAFTLVVMTNFLRRHARLPIKGALLLQAGFPGIGNWMADEVLWRARLSPQRRTARLNSQQLQRLWRALRFVSREALRRIGKDHSDPPQGWFFHQRWGPDGHCPRDGTPLQRGVVGGRTTAWCPQCQVT
jgi:formamidopyrimidine-DNA glycosylase